MSRKAIRAALETALKAVDPSFETAWENQRKSPPANAPYQRVSLHFAKPVHDEMHAARTEQGFLQVTLCYSKGAGPGAAEAKADAICAAMPYGSTYPAASGAYNVTIEAHGEQLAGFEDGDRWCVPVRLQFQADIPA